MDKYKKIGFVNGSAPALNADNLNHMDEGIEKATDGVTAVEEALKATINGIDSAMANKAEKSTVNLLSARVQSAETSLAGKASATDVTAVGKVLEGKENNSNIFCLWFFILCTHYRTCRTGDSLCNE